jgi:homoserine O-acetyltransferase/O-succinyltransferase
MESIIRFIGDASAAEGDVQVFDAGSVTLRSGAELRSARLVYAVHGTLNAAGDNAILLPTFYGGTHADVAYLIGPDRALDPTRYFIVVPNLFGNGVSTSPSTGSSPFPLVTIHDNVGVQHRLIREVLGISALQLVIGFSMGGQQAYEWACRFPSMVRRLAVICSAARTTPHTWVFLEGLKAVLQTDDAAHPASHTGATDAKRALARVWAGWGLSQTWYRDRRYEQDGYATVADYLQACWDSEFDQWDARDLLSMLETWQAHDVGGPGGTQRDFEAAMATITAPCLIMPSSTDLYFPPEDSADEAALLSRGRLAVIESVLGHQAGGGDDPADLAFINREVRALLGRPPFQDLGSAMHVLA